MNLFKRILTAISIVLITLSIIVIVIYASALSSETGDFPFLDDYVVSSKVPERPVQNSKFIYESYDESKYNYAGSFNSKIEEKTEPKATISLSCPTKMEVGSSVVVTVSTANLKGEYSLQISGTNLVDGYFVEGNEILFHANKNGSATIYACSDYDSSIISNKITISVTGNAIATAEDLRKLNGSSSNYILVDDIDLATCETWEPIEGFTGTLEGKGHSISNLTIVGKDEKSSLGIFKEFAGNVKNISFENINIKTESNSKNIGIIADVIKGGRIESVSVDGSIDALYSENVGGFFGKYENGDILNCKNYAIVSAKSVVGGIVGELPINDLGVFTKNTNYGAISSSEEKVGGIVGYVYATEPKKGINEKLFSENKNEGEIHGAKNVGGIVGTIEGFYYKRYSDVYSLKINVSNCSNSGIIISSGDFVGGIVGFGNNMNSFKECTNRGDITGKNWVGGIVGRTDAMVYANGFSNENSITGYAYIGGVAGECGGISDASNDGKVVTVGFRLEEDVKVSNVGGVVGLCRGSMENCSNSNEVKSTSGGISVGGVVGALECNTSTKINGNSNSGNVSSNGDNTGGVFGRVYTREPSSSGSFDVQLAGASNDGNVNGAKNVGGVAGSVEGFYYKRYSDVYSLKINVSNCSNTGKIVASGNYAGGVIGYGSNMNSFKENTNVADITGVNWVGGLAGRTDAIVYASGFSNKNTITGYAYIGGVVGECRGISDASNDGNVLSVGSKLEDGVKVSNVGGVVGLCIGSVENCSNLKGINVLSGGFNVGGVGGVVECNTSSKLNGNINVGTVLSNGENTGGVFGRVYAKKPSAGTYEIELSKAGNKGSVTGNKKVGGVVGSIEGCEKLENETYGSWCRLKINVSDCSNTENVIALDDYVGGIVGYGNNMNSFKNSTNIGDITGVNWVGGLVGRIDAVIYANGFANENTITGYSYIGGLAGECKGMIDASNNGDVVSLGSRFENGIKISNVGGVAGFCRGSVVNCHNLIELKTSFEGCNVGGVVGIVECSATSELNGNINLGSVSSNGDNTGGVFGKVYASKPSAGNYEVQLVGANNEGNVSGLNNVGGIAGIIEGCEKLENETYGRWCRLKINVSNCSNAGRVFAFNENQGSIVGFLGSQAEVL